ncbi:hypothetical protein Moror_9780 [Moniliophthora roreri MCA 2997]|uniref:Uncharacterized protein n=1 Tax=Moniliophthora roreri (strain MCA 2997) TaxID=1381753 RepID=V2WYC8_MONRO|nr:hypothetical protein Moror_9780 [Moniliophthora roreri MCA 2997]
MGGHTHFWSFDETSQLKILEEEWEQWDIPVIYPYTDAVWLYSWPIHIYTTFHDWQIAQGFDPTTSNWAQSMGYSELEIIGAEEKKGQFEELVEHKPDLDMVEPLPEVMQGSVDQPDFKAVKKQYKFKVLQGLIICLKSGFGWFWLMWIFTMSVQLIVFLVQ